MIDVGELAVLQEIDIRLDAARADLQGIDEQIATPSTLAPIGTELAAQEERFHAAGRERASLEAEADATRGKITEMEGRLYGGTIREPRELRGIQEDVYALRRLLREQDDEQLERLEREESEQAAQDHVRGLRDAVEAAWNARQSELAARQAALAAAAEEIAAELGTAREQIPSEGLAAYDQQRKLLPQAIARVSGGTCGGCRIALPMHTITRARRRSDAVHCPTCKRLLYIP